jgi:hypothetical protein
MRRRLGLAATLTGLACLMLVSAAAGSQLQTIDFSTAPSASLLPKDFYRAQGIVFNEEYFVGFIQGDEALVSGSTANGDAAQIGATFTAPVTALSVEVAPAFGGTAEYTLTAFDSGGHAVATKSVTRTEDPGDPADQGFGYFPIDLGPLSDSARSFTLTNRFIRSSTGTPICEGGGLACFSFGVSTITYTIQLDPTTKDQCKNGGWRDFPKFKNQGQCIAFVNHGP